MRSTVPIPFPAFLRSLRMALLCLAGVPWLACGGGSNTEQASKASSDSLEAKEVSADSPLQRQLQDLNYSLRYDSTDPALYADRADVYRKQGKLDSAQQDWQQALRLDSTNAAYHKALGHILYAKGNDARAKEQFLSVLDLGGGDDAVLYHELANTLVAEGNYETALAYYDSAALKAPADPDPLFAKAFALRKQSQVERAIHVAQVALSRDSMNVKALNLLFELFLYDKESPEKAYGIIKRMKRGHPNHPVAHFNQGRLFWAEYIHATYEKPKEAGQYLKAAAKAYTNAVEADANYAEAFYNRGYVFFEMKRHDRALKDFKEAARLSPDDHRPHFMMGSIYELLKDRKEAISHYRRVLELKPGHSKASEALRELGAQPAS